MKILSHLFVIETFATVCPIHKNPFKHEASCLKRFPVSSFKDSVNFYSFSFKTMLSKIFKVTPQITAINTGDVQSIFIKGDREFAQST